MNSQELSNVLSEIFPDPSPHGSGAWRRNSRVLLVVVGTAYHELQSNSDGTYPEWGSQKIGGYTFLVAPNENYDVSVKTNGYRGTMDGATYGAALTLMVFNHWLWEAHAKRADPDFISKMSSRFYAMRNAAISDGSPLHAGAILSFLD